MNTSKLRIYMLQELGTNADIKATIHERSEFLVKANALDAAKNATLAALIETCKSPTEYVKALEEADKALAKGYIDLCKEYNINIENLSF